MKQTQKPGSFKILLETLEAIKKKIDKNDPAIIERVVLGIFFTGVKLSNGRGGVCYTPIKTIPEAVCCPSSARVMPTPGRLCGKNAVQFAQKALSGSPLQKAVGIAVINALSDEYLIPGQSVGYTLKSGIDPIDELSLSDDDLVVVVGALVPYLRMLKTRGKPFCVLEQDPATLKADEMPFYAPAEKAPEKIPQADVLITTGTTLINGTLEALLEMARPDARIVVVGPTASMLPEAFFKRGVNTVGGVRVIDPDPLLDILAEGGSGYHFFGKTAEKISIMKTV